jgi:hypothetical protein
MFLISKSKENSPNQPWVPIDSLCLQKNTNCSRTLMPHCRTAKSQRTGITYALLVLIMSSSTLIKNWMVNIKLNFINHPMSKFNDHIYQVNPIITKSREDITKKISTKSYCWFISIASKARGSSNSKTKV